MRQSDVDGEGKGMFTLRDIKHREKVIDYQGRYCNLRQFIEKHRKIKISTSKTIT